MALRALIALAAIGISSHAYAAGCNQFFYKQPVYQQYAYPVLQAVQLSPYIYQAGRDIEADAFVEKLARSERLADSIAQKLAQKLTTLNVQQQTAPAPVRAVVLSQKCARCHNANKSPNGLILDGTGPVPDWAYRSFHRMAGLGEGIPPEMVPVIKSLTQDDKGRLTEEMLRLPEQQRPQPPAELAPLQQPDDRRPPAELPPPPPGVPGELK